MLRKGLNVALKYVVKSIQFAEDTICVLGHKIGVGNLGAIASSPFFFFEGKLVLECSKI